MLKISNPKGIYFYDGDWVNDEKSGKGTEIWDNDSMKASYKGTFVNGVKQGHGKYDDKAYSYKGNWEQDVRSGEGEFLDKKTGHLYLGTFSNGGQLNGQGTKYFKDGTSC